MKSFQYHIPTFISFGLEAHELISDLAANLRVKRALIVYGSDRLEKTGIIRYIEESLAGQGIEYRHVCGVVPNPRYEQTLQMAKEAAEFDPELVIGAGGGSAIDTAKAIALYLNNQDQDFWKVWCKEVPYNPARATGAVLTIPAAGSETSDSAVLTNETLHIKRGFSDSSLRPLFAILNPGFCSSLPHAQAAAGVCDILMHTLDRYFTHNDDNSLTDEIAEALLRNTIRYGKTFAEHPDDIQAASEIMWAGSLSHNNLTGLGRAKDFSVHQLGHELSAAYDLRHGDSLSVMYPSWARYVMPCAPARFARLARNVLGVREEDDIQAARQGIDAMEAYFSSLGLPVTLEQALPDVAFDEAVFEALARGCSRNETRMIGQFMPIGKQQMQEIYRMAWQGSEEPEKGLAQS